MQTLKERISQIPEGAAALFFIQIFATLGFAVLYSTLVLYATKHLKFSAKEATAIMGVFGAFNYGLHLFGGYLGGRFLSNRNLFVGGMLLQVFGCAWIAVGSTSAMYWGLALFLTGSGLNVTCLNMMLTQRFSPQDERRESAFLWNYAGMNIGFFIGFAVAGYYQKSEGYSSLFYFATIGNILAIILAYANWRRVADLDTPLLKVDKAQFRRRLALGLAILVGVPPMVWFMLQRTGPTGTAMKVVSALVAASLIVMTVKHPDRREKNNMWAYLILTLGSLVFWSLYQMAPSGLQLFADNNVDLHVFGYSVAPQWVQNINTVVIVVGGPILAAWFAKLRKRGWMVDIPLQFTLSLVLMGLGFLALPLGISLADATGRSPFFWLFLSYVLQSIGELLISPIGYAMIGKLAPAKYQGIMMGSWMMVSGLASIFAGDLSGMVPEPKGTTALATNHEYSVLFTKLGIGTIIASILLALLVPKLRTLIKDAVPAADPAPDVAPAEALKSVDRSVA
ncbi:MAG: peptide MFS transporter [Myxococcales bacterium]|nr:peptide MFS transporter [Myxococcales bacterium]